MPDAVPAQHAQPPPAGARTVRVWDGPWIDRPKAQRAFEHQFDRDRLGHRVHTVLAALAVFMVALPNSVSEIGAAVLGIYALIRIRHTGGQWLHWFAQPATLAWLIFAIWTAITLFWSPDRRLGLDELDSLRWLLFGWALWAVIDHRRLFIAALALGFLAGHGSQVVQFLAIEFGWERFDFNRFPDRVSGWWDPAVAGTILTAAVGLHLPAAVWGHRGPRCAGLAGCALALVGLVATGSRGGWIASAALIALIALAAVWVWWKRGHRRLKLRGWLAFLGAALLAFGLGAAAWATLGDRITGRVNEAREEVRLAFEEGESDSPTGLRVAMVGAAWDATVANPVGGVGAGGFAEWGREHNQIDAHDHAHNQLLHTSATTGLVGTAILILAAGLSLRAAAVRAGSVCAVRDETHGKRVCPDRGWAIYDAGPAWALMGLGLVSAFDTVLANSTTAAVAGVLIGLSPVFAPERRFTTEDAEGAQRGV